MVNICVKNREEFRPFAPAVLEEEMKKYFKIDYLSPYMLFVCDVKKEARPLLPAITHIDGTARVQTVNKEVNPRFWKVIKEFGKITGIPVLLNTSFNVRGEPIVCNPKDAIRCFYSTGLDYLIMGNYLLSKK